MDFSEQNAQSMLPQFSEISSRTNTSTSSYVSSGDHQIQSSQSAIYTTASDANSLKQILINSPNKFPNTILNWPDPNALMQLCEKQALQSISIPGYSQNNSGVAGQSHNLPMRIIPNAYVSQTDNNSSKNDMINVKMENEEANVNSMNSQALQQQSLVMAEYLQKLQSSSLPITLQQLIKIQSEQVKKGKDDEQKNDQIQNNILNIPTVPIYKNSQMQNDSQYMNNDHSMISLNPSDVNVHIEEQPENRITTAQSQAQNIKMEQTVQTEPPKPEKKVKFRAKTGEIKVTIALDGSTLYCCPECNLAFAQKIEIEQHIQIHVQERKYQCKECGAMLKRKEHLDQHMRGHSDERPFKCPVCQKAFKRNEHLTRHYVIHSGDKSFSCEICSKAFSRKDHLNKHRSTHLGLKKMKQKKELNDSGSNGAIEASNSAAVAATSMLLRPDLNNLLKEGNFKQDTTHLLQHIQNLHKDSNLMQTFSAFKEQVLRDGSTIQQQAVNMNEILPQNNRYLMPS